MDSLRFLKATDAEFDAIQRRTMRLVREREAYVLREAAMILRANSSKPNGLAMRVLCKLLDDQAAKIEDVPLSSHGAEF